MMANRSSSLRIDVPDDKRPVSIDETRIFYRETSYPNGGMRMNWIDYQTDNVTGIVQVIYPGGHSVELRGRDAFTFLRIVRDKAANEFETFTHRN